MIGVVLIQMNKFGMDDSVGRVRHPNRVAG